MLHTRAVADAIADEAAPEPGPLRRLRRLVSALIVVLIAGVLTVSITLVIRLKSLGGGAGLAAPIAAAGLAVPQGHGVVAVGRAGAEVLMVTQGPDGARTLRAYDAATGVERSATPISP